MQGLAHHFLLDPTQAATAPFLQTVSPAAISGHIASDAFDYCVGKARGNWPAWWRCAMASTCFATGPEVQTRGIAYVPMRLSPAEV